MSENGNIKSLLSTKENEIKILQEYVRSYLRNNGKETAEKIEELIQAGEILATNQVLTSDRDSLKEQLGKEEETRKLLEGRLLIIYFIKNYNNLGKKISNFHNSVLY